jgi:hypothetical protein
MNRVSLARLTVIAALMFMALRPAAAEEDVWKDLGKTMFDCNDVIVETVHLSDMEWYRIEIAVEHKRKKHAPVVTFNAEKQTLMVDGKRCPWPSKKIKERDCKEKYDTSDAGDMMSPSYRLLREQDFRECMKNAEKE